MKAYTWEDIVNIPRALLIGLIKMYRYALSSLIPSRCRFYPSCSAYGLEALNRHGFLTGSKLILLRLLRCHPWHPGGFDPVPKKYSGYHWRQSDNHIHSPECVARSPWISKEHS